MIYGFQLGMTLAIRWKRPKLEIHILPSIDICTQVLSEMWAVPVLRRGCVTCTRRTTSFSQLLFYYSPNLLCESK